MHHKWENAFTVDSGSWGYRRNMQIREILTIEELLQQIVTTVSCGGEIPSEFINTSANTYVHVGKLID